MKMGYIYPKSVVLPLATDSLAASGSAAGRSSPSWTVFWWCRQAQQNIEIRVFTPKLTNAHITGLHQVQEVDRRLNQCNNWHRTCAHMLSLLQFSPERNSKRPSFFTRQRPIRQEESQSELVRVRSFCRFIKQFATAF